MKITKQQLRRIIKEERARLIQEAPDVSTNAGIVEMAKYAGKVADSANVNLRKLIDPADETEGAQWKDITDRIEEVKEILHKIANLYHPEGWEDSDDTSYGGRRPRAYSDPYGGKDDPSTRQR